MSTRLSDIELRLLGSLIEKQVTTPEYYPLTLNALTLACNQKNNRHPVTAFDEAAVAQALETLREKNLTYVFQRQQQLRESASTSGALCVSVLCGSV